MAPNRLRARSSLELQLQFRRGRWADRADHAGQTAAPHAATRRCHSVPLHLRRGQDERHPPPQEPRRHSPSSVRISTCIPSVYHCTPAPLARPARALPLCSFCPCSTPVYTVPQPVSLAAVLPLHPHPLPCPDSKADECVSACCRGLASHRTYSSRSQVCSAEAAGGFGPATEQCLRTASPGRGSWAASSSGVDGATA